MAERTRKIRILQELCGICGLFFFSVCVRCGNRVLYRQGNESRLMMNLEKYQKDLGSGNEKIAAAAFCAIYDIFKVKCWSFALSLLKDEEMSRDVVHDVFVKVWLHRDKVTDATSISSYLFRMMSNAVKDVFKQQSRSAEFVKEASVNMEGLSDAVNEDSDLTDTREMISEALNEMPEKRRNVFLMSRVNGIPNDDIAEMLGVSKRTVENHLSRAMKDVRDKFERYKN